ncbi:MAG TPA: hypothetical protein GXZ78_01765 [Eubacteriaceae bacterium]|nr:hypothetical protein [Eubacteriaceae bacterium]
MNIKVNNRNMVILSIMSVAITWLLNHEVGYGAVVSNGVVGVIGAILLPGPLAGAVFTSSFVGMSGLNVIPSLTWAVVGGAVVGVVIVLTKEIYVGIGGKGGTTAATSALITKAIISIFN